MNDELRLAGRLGVVAAALIAMRAAGDTLRVPGEFTTIQSAIDAAGDGDEVLVADGTYTGPGNRDLDFAGKLITVRSEHGPQQCIIDCQGNNSSQHRGFIFDSGETSASVLDGITIRNGFTGGTGGGIYCAGSSPTIRNCIISGNRTFNHTTAGGGGIKSSNGSPTIVNCTFSENVASGADVWGSGGGLSCTGGTPMIVDCKFLANGAGGYSGARGGGAAFDGGLAVVVNCTFAGNTGGSGGSSTGALYNTGTLTLVNCLFSGNTASSPYRVPGLNNGGTLTAINCTFSGNHALSGHLGGFLYNSGTALLSNCIVWGNQPAQFVGTSPTTAAHSDIEFGLPGAGADNIAADPLFFDPDGADDILGTLDDDPRPQPGSPCIDAGMNSAVPPEITTDLDGEPRFADDPGTPDCPQAPGACGPPPVVDMGAHEFHLPCPWDVDRDADVGGADLAALLDAWGTGPGGPPDFDGDGVVGIGDFLALLANWGSCCDRADAAFPDCNHNGALDICDLASGTSADCNGNGIPDECELVDDCNGNGVNDACDIDSGTSADADGNGIPDECKPPQNDACANAAPIGEGDFPFSTIGALTDGLPQLCAGGPDLTFFRDIWFLYSPSCFGTATFSVCDAASYDTRLAVYYAAPCPPVGGALACSDNAPGCGETSQVQLLVHPSIQYLVRIGGTTMAGGSGTLTVTCQPY